MKMDMFTLCRFLLDAESKRLPNLVLQLATEDTQRFDGNFKISPEFSAFPSLETALQSFLEATKDEALKGEITGRENNLRRALKQYINGLPKDRAKELIKFYAGDAHPLHIRRTLDQYVYYMLDNIAPRNKDQVVSRFGDKAGVKPIVMMVDQLWLWIIGSKSLLYVISSDDSAS